MIFLGNNVAAVSPSVGVAFGKRLILQKESRVPTFGFYFRKSYVSAVRLWWLRRKVSLQRKMLNSMQGGRRTKKEIPIHTWKYNTI